MYGDIIECLNPFCKRRFKDTTKLKMQDSRSGKFKNTCPDCYGTNTVNLHEDTKAKDKFIYDGEPILEEAHNKMNKRVRKPNMSTEYIATEVLGKRQECDVSEDKERFSEDYGRTVPRGEGMPVRDFVESKGGTYHVDHIKSFTPLELMQQKLNNQHEELKSKPNNYKLYRGWHYHRRIKKC